MTDRRRFLLTALAGALAAPVAAKAQPTRRLTRLGVRSLAVGTESPLTSPSKALVMSDTVDELR
jgi:hypothetical protein